MEKKSNIKKIKRKVRRSTLFFLIFAFMANAFAWFIYSNKVSNQLTTGVKSWKVTFEQDGNDLTDNVFFEIDSIYPGMEPFKDSIEINNSGELPAYITYQVKSVKIFDETYTDQDYSSEELEEILSTHYPFKVTFTIDQSEIPVGTIGTFSVQLDWPYESGNDELDTFWGKKSYQYQQDYPDETQIEINVKLTASQKKPQN